MLFLLSAVRSAQSLKTQVGNLLSLPTHSLAVKRTWYKQVLRVQKKWPNATFRVFTGFASRISSRAAKPARYENLEVFISSDVHAVRAGIKLKGQPPLNNSRVFRHSGIWHKQVLLEDNSYRAGLLLFPFGPVERGFDKTVEQRMWLVRA